MRSVRIWFNKTGTAKYISHLDLTRCMIRAFRRTDIPLWYTEGFNPHPYLVFGLSLPLGVEGLREPLDIRLNDETYPMERVIEQLNNVTVPGISFLEISEPIKKPLEIYSGEYSVVIPCENDSEELCELIADTINKKTITYQKKVKKGGFKPINVSEHLKDFNASYSEIEVKLTFNLPAGNDFTINAVSFCDALFEMIGKKDILYRITRHKLLMKDGTEFK